MINVILLALLLCGGCVLKDPAKVPHVDGRWTGRLESIKVYDRDGNVLDAAVLRIEKGTALPERWVAEAPEGPILADYEEGRALSVSGLPIGKRVEVAGTVLKGIIINHRGDVYSDSSVSRVPHRPTADEILLVVRHPPK